MSDALVIVGPGRMGLALGSALVRSGAVRRLVYHGRSIEPPPHPLFDSEGGGAEYRIGPHPVPDDTTIVLLAVPDREIGDAAHDLAAVGEAPAGCVALHLSGAASTDGLAPLHRAGYAVGSLHPLQSVADPWSAGARLIGSAFALAGEPVALAAGRRLVEALDGNPLVIPPVLRPAYHAAAVVASNYLVVLIATAARMLSQAGVAEQEALPALLPLVKSTIDNIDHLGLSAALTGPIARGDIDTVRLHLNRLSGEDRALYCALGRETLRLARATGLDEAQAAALDSLLSD